MNVKRYEAYTTIVNRGDESYDLCLIKKGMVKVLKSTPKSLCVLEGSKGEEDGSTVEMSRVGVVEESPGIWVIQKNWREVLEKKAKMTMREKIEEERRNNHDFTVGVLGSGEFFGELAVLGDNYTDKNEPSPVTVIACTNVELYCLSHEDVMSLNLGIDQGMKRCLEESLVMHNPPPEKVGHFFRGKLKWEAKKVSELSNVRRAKRIAEDRLLLTQFFVASLIAGSHPPELHEQ